MGDAICFLAFPTRHTHMTANYDQTYYQNIWGSILRKYTLDSPIRDFGDVTRATLVARFVQRYVFAHRKKNQQQDEALVIQDYGAGNWLYLGALYRTMDSYGAGPITLTGFDYSEEALRFGIQKVEAERPPHVTVSTCAGDLLDGIKRQPEQSVNGIISLETLEHVYPDREVIQEFCRILKPGGVLIISVPSNQPFLLSRNWFDYVFFRQRFTEKDKRVGHLRRYSTASMIQLVLSNTGMDLCHLEPYGFLSSDYIKILSAWLYRWVPGLGERLFPWLAHLLFLEHRWWNACGVRRSEGFFAVFQKGQEYHDPR